MDTMAWRESSSAVAAVGAAAGLGVGGAAVAVAKEDPAFRAGPADRSTVGRRTHRNFISSLADLLRFARHGGRQRE